MRIRTHFLLYSSTLGDTTSGIGSLEWKVRPTPRELFAINETDENSARDPKYFDFGKQLADTFTINAPALLISCIVIYNSNLYL